MAAGGAMPEIPRAETAALERMDVAARERALDVTRSFLVQAPAGSGKTGLLIQRFLALLGHTDRPERVVAITFTRKAATEMRERVLNALREAEEGVAIDAAHTHDALTRRLAERALAQDRRHGWNLTVQPARLRMTTIDALATALSRRAPVATGLGALPAFVDDAWPLYASAAADALAEAPADDAAWRRFLTHVDNDADRAVALLAGLLAKRDQWLQLPVGGDGTDIRIALERTLREEIDATLAHVRDLFPSELVGRLREFAGYAAGNLADRSEDGTRTAALVAFAARGGLPPAQYDAMGEWSALADWLLVKTDARFRSGGTGNEGFPAVATGAGSADRGRRNGAFRAWLADAAGKPGLAQALAGVRALPPVRYGDDAWAFVQATLELLRRCAAHLLTVFAREGAADFAEATLRALAALGNADDPGELLLALDYQIAHLLVDEFQDTSWPQLELIARLTSGWEPGDGRTLFAVGDPMQSIYRFREAEVGIFVESQDAGRIAGITVECLDLARNFRSQRPVVAWVNQVFPRVLPAVADAGRGEVAYKPVLATRGVDGAPGPTVELVSDVVSEAAAVVARVRAALADRAPEIAILVRARPHLDTILPALRAAGVEYAAIDLESLAERLATRDLASLTRALIQPSERLAAFAVLRAPWCGLALADLLALAEQAGGRPILEIVADPDAVSRLSADGARRVERVTGALATATATRGRVSLTARVRAAWLMLGGPACAEGELDLAGAERYFALLAAHERGGDLPDWDAFVAAAKRLHAEPATGAVVQVMTLHKAKGLEFDTVILPGLGRGGRRSDDEALRWKTRERHGRAALLLAPLAARTGVLREQDPVYAYLKKLAADEDAAELGRLLYVGCTRARRRLHLIATAKTVPPDGEAPARWRNPVSGSSLAALWPALAASVAPPTAVTGSRDDDDEDGNAVAEARPLLRLPEDWSPPLPRATVPHLATEEFAGAVRPAFEWAHATAAAVGTVAHRLFAQIAQDGIAGWNGPRIAAQLPRVRAELAAEGVPADELAAAARQVEAAARGLIDSERGRWLFSRDHVDARSEWSLTGVDGEAIVHVVLDRTFVAGGTRWIVDFKTGTHEGADLETFLDREVERYRDQLERYARIVAALDARPVRLALFYPLLGAWRDWAWAPQDPPRSGLATPAREA